MSKFKVLMRVDAYVDYKTEIEAESPNKAAEIAYYGGSEIAWEELGTQQFDARRVVALDDDGNEIDATKHGKG